jgi:cytochrome c oxidase subunit 2
MNGFRLFPEQSSTFASRVDALFFFILAVAAFFAILIAGCIVYFSVRYRRRPEHPFAPAAQPVLWVECAWTALPLVIVLVIFVWGSRLYVSAYSPPRESMEVHVVGKQWMWKVQHPQGRREINELHVPLNTPVRLAMISQDVIHDFYIPEFRIKQDVLPGRYTYTWFEATRLGEGHLFCAQYCGTQHAQMIGRVVVMQPADYANWLRGLTPGEESTTGAGELLYRQFGCNACHGVKAPTLAGLYGSTVTFADGSTVVADESYLREHILTPRNRTVAGYASTMPSYRGQLNEEQLVQLIAYIKTLRVEKTP